MKRRDLFRTEEIRAEFDEKYAEEMALQDRAATDPIARKQVHRKEGMIIGLLAIIFGISAIVYHWLYGTFPLKISVVAIVAVVWAIVKMLISFLPHKTPMDGSLK